MTWVKIDDQFPEHPKVLRVGAEASWLYVSALCYSARQLTDGFIPSAVLGRLAEVRRPLDLAGRLVDVGLWSVVDGGWQVNDYLEYQPSREKVLREREAAAERKERWKERKRNAVPNADGTQTERKRNGPPDPNPYPTRPDRAKGRVTGPSLKAAPPPAPDGGGGESVEFDPELAAKSLEQLRKIRGKEA